MNTLRYGYILLAVVVCATIYELRYAKFRYLAIFFINDKHHLLEDEKNSDLKKAFTNGTIVQLQGQKDNYIENVATNGSLLKRIKKSIMNYGECPEGFMKLKVLSKILCVTCDEYSELTGNDC